MKKRINLAFIGTYPEVSRIFLDATTKIEDIHAISIDASFESAAEKAQELEPQLDAILSRGGTAEYIQNSVDIPVIYIPITPFDVAKVIHNLPKGTNKVAIVHYRKNILNIKDFEALYHMEFFEYFFSSYGDIECAIQNANEKGIQVVLGGEVATQIAKKYGMRGEVISAGYEAVMHAIEETLQVLREKKKEQDKSAQIKAAFSALVEGIVISDEERRVVSFNPVAEKIFHRRYEAGEVLGNDVFDDYCKKIYDERENAHEISEVRRMVNGIYAVSHTPIKAEGRFIGLVSRYEDVTKVQKLEQQIRKEIHAKGFVAKRSFNDILGRSPEIKKTIDMAQIYAKVDSSILIEGESGTGKEFFAQGIHNASSRRNGPFVAVNCTAIPENLLESELFGYETGAFTGAKKEGKAGLFEMAHGGTLFLDEIGEITEQVQARLLRVLQEREIMRVGGDKVIPIDVRIISATNRNLWNRTKEGTFRVDLYYRLNIFHLEIPPLRERTGDIRVLCEAFAERKQITLEPTFYKTFLPIMERYSWHGNVRELESVMERYGLLKTIWKGDKVVDEQINALLGLSYWDQKETEISAGMRLPKGKDLREMVENLEYEIVSRVLKDCGNDQAEAARVLGIGKTTLWRKLRLGNGQLGE